MLVRVISYISKIINLDLFYYLKGGSWLALANFLGIALSLGISVFFARFASLELYGQYKFALAVFGLLSIFTLPGMNKAIAQAVARGKIYTLVQGTKIKLKFSFLSAFPLIGLAFYFIAKGQRLGWAFLFSIPLYPFAFGFANQEFLNAREYFREGSLYGLARTGLRVMLVGMFLLITRNIVLIVIAHLLAFVIINGITFKRLLSYMIAVDKRDNTELYQYGIQLTLIQIFAIIARYTDRFLLVHFTSFSSLAYYAVAFALPEAIKGALKQINPLVFPRITNTPKTKVYAKIRKKLPHLVLFGVVISLLLIVSLPRLIILIYTERYIMAILPARVLSLSLIIYPLFQILTSTLLGHQRVKDLYVLRALETIVRIGAFAVFIPFYGVLGAALSYMVTRFVATFYTYWAVKRMSLE